MLETLLTPTKIVSFGGICAAGRERPEDCFRWAIKTTMKATFVNSASLRQPAWQGYFAWWAWLCCAVSLAFSQAVPTTPVVIFLGVAGLYSLFFPARPYRALTWNFVPWMIVGLAALSAMWSDVPMHSARAAAQIGLTTLIAIMFAQNLPAFSYISVLMYAFLASVVASLYLPGIFGAKNSQALAIALLLLSSCWVMLDKQQPKIARMVALLALLGTPPMLLAAGSEGALLGAGFALLCSFVPFLLKSLRSRTRIFLLGLGVLVAGLSVGIALLLFDNLFDILLGSIGKDSTLTGRTLLWSQAIDIIADHPLGGLGLQAFWVEGNRAAERFWAFFLIYTRYGFHFHNLWLEMGVELGIPGIVIAAVTTLVVIFNVYWWVLNDPTPESCFFAGFASLTVFRTFGEVELYVQFFLMPMIFMSGYYYAASARSASRLKRAVPSVSHEQVSLAPLTT
jgi:exopolysaccharide production protein ExoQ